VGEIRLAQQLGVEGYDSQALYAYPDITSKFAAQIK
jgi:hypothetical protein